jgi:hypothetical protein
MRSTSPVPLSLAQTAPNPVAMTPPWVMSAERATTSRPCPVCSTGRDTSRSAVRVAARTIASASTQASAVPTSTGCETTRQRAARAVRAKRPRRASRSAASRSWNCSRVTKSSFIAALPSALAPRPAPG